MFFYLFKIIIIFPILFFFIIRPINEFLLEDHLVPFLNDLFLKHPGINFDFSNDNLIFRLNDASHYYSLPFNEFYIMFFIIFFSKIFLKEYLHFHIINFSLILFAPFFYFFILLENDAPFTFFSIIQGTVNFYFLIIIFLDYLKKYGPKSFRMKLIKYY